MIALSDPLVSNSEPRLDHVVSLACSEARPEAKIRIAWRNQDEALRSEPMGHEHGLAARDEEWLRCRRRICSRVASVRPLTLSTAAGSERVEPDYQTGRSGRSINVPWQAST